MVRFSLLALTTAVLLLSGSAHAGIGNLNFGDLFTPDKPCFSASKTCSAARFEDPLQKRQCYDVASQCKSAILSLACDRSKPGCPDSQAACSSAVSSCGTNYSCFQAFINCGTAIANNCCA